MRECAYTPRAHPILHVRARVCPYISRDYAQENRCERVPRPLMSTFFRTACLLLFSLAAA
eukprot:6200285-Pleurochrysis_carterae.AAC.1